MIPVEQICGQRPCKKAGHVLPPTRTSPPELTTSVILALTFYMVVIMNKQVIMMVIIYDGTTNLWKTMASVRSLSATSCVKSETDIPSRKQSDSTHRQGLFSPRHN
jgi:hypothetical protein